MDRDPSGGALLPAGKKHVGGRHSGISFGGGEGLVGILNGQRSAKKCGGSLPDGDRGREESTTLHLVPVQLGTGAV